MAWLLGIVLIIVAAAVAVLFLNRFYVKSTRDAALIRTGAGGRKIIIDGGALALPILHRVDRMNMRSVRLQVERTGTRALISEDRLRVDLTMEFHLRVDPTPDGIATAAQALGSKAFREDEMQALMAGKLVDAVQAEIARRSMDELHVDRGGFSEAVAARLAANLARSGLVVDSVSLIHLDQTPFADLDDNNAFNAVGMRRLAETIAENRKARIDIEAEADTSVRRRQLEQTKERLAIEREQQEFEIVSKLEIERQRIRHNSELDTSRTEAERLAEEQRIAKARDLKQAEIERDLTLRRREMEALLEVEAAKIDNAIRIAAKRGEETQQQAKAEAARVELIEAQEQVQTSRDLAAAERGRKLAQVKAQQDSETDDGRVKSKVSSILSTAKAESEAVQLRATAERDRLVAEAAGRSAEIQADNQQSDAVLRARVEMHKIDRLPEIATQMMKPVEKIESIRINQIGGLGGRNGAGDGDGTPFGQALDSILGMSVQLPFMKKLGDEIGLDFDAQLAGRTADAAGRAAAATRPKKDG
ncbi:MAG: flotillin domain-containing protein [Nitratireductor sp.]